MRLSAGRQYIDVHAVVSDGEQVDADVGFVKVWDGELTLAEIQAQHGQYKTRFGY